MRVAIISIALCVGCSHELRAPEDRGLEQAAADGGSMHTSPPAHESDEPDQADAEPAAPRDAEPATPPADTDGGVIDGGADRGDGGDAGEGGMQPLNPAPNGLSPEAGWYTTSPRCPDEVLPARKGSGAADRYPQYPLTYVEVIRGAEGLPTTAFSARWTGLRKLEAPTVLTCLPAFVTTPPGIPCQVDSVLELTTSTGSKVEILLGLAYADLTRFADGRSVSVLVGSVQQGILELKTTRPLEIRDAAGALLVAVAARGSLPALDRQLSGWSWDDLKLSFEQIHCVPERDSCMRVFISRKLTVSGPGTTATHLDPGQGAVFSSKGHSYRLTYRRGVERAYGVFQPECADASGPSHAVEFVQLP